jgi:hypothetical protein
MKYFDWTEEKNYTLAQLVLKYKGYKTTDIKQSEKWETILEKIKFNLDLKILLSSRFHCRLILKECKKIH